MPTCLPVTEEEPRHPESAYSLSKLVGETMAEQFARWDPETKIISLRFSNVMLPQEYASFDAWQEDPKARYWNCWGYIDARDGGQSVSKALAVDKKGHHAYLIAAPDTCMKMGNEELIKACFPGVKYNKTPRQNDSLLSIEKAKKELGFEPKYTWQDPKSSKA
jgi:nucleoside-diphosphate-sugar epimerase